MMKRTVIRGTGRYLPPRVVNNDDLTQWMDTSDEWIRQRTGIEKRHWIPAEGEVGSSDLGLEAAKIALQRAGWEAAAVDLIINIQRYGNTTAASIPIAFDEALEMNRIGPGSTVLFLGLGAGLTWGAVIARLGN